MNNGGTNAFGQYPLPGSGRTYVGVGFVQGGTKFQ